MRLIGIIQARDNNTRLPGKALMDINGELMIEHVYKRAKAVRRFDEVVISTSKNSPRIIEWAHRSGIDVNVGLEENLLKRHLTAMLDREAAIGVRWTADCPFHDPWLTEKLIDAFLASGDDIMANWYPNQQISEGLDAAIFTSKLLEKLSDDKDCPREDWINYAARKYQKWLIHYIERGTDLHLSVDTPDDLERARKMMAYLGNDEYRYEKTLEAYEATK